jgi:hypothetical protein
MAEKQMIHLESSQYKYSTIEDGFSSRHTLTQVAAKADEGVRFEVKLTHHPLGGSPGKKKPSIFTREGQASAMGKAALSHQLSPIHARGLTLLENATAGGLKNAFDKSYLDPPKPQLNSQNFREVGERGGSLLETKRRVKEYIEQFNGQLTETKKQEISQIRDFRQYVKLIGNELQ